MFGKNQSSLSSSVIIPATVLFGLMVSVFVAIILFSSSRHIAASLPGQKNSETQSADVAGNYLKAMETLRESVATSKESAAAVIERVDKELLSVRVPANGLDKHLHAVITVEKMKENIGDQSDADIKNNLVSILEALTHS
jgi:hypothetical protein